ncbi:hypothetical protein ACJX0J_005762, partial [Zea mays]
REKKESVGDVYDVLVAWLGMDLGLIAGENSFFFPFQFSASLFFFLSVSLFSHYLFSIHISI